MVLQKTISREVDLVGVNVYTGRKCSVTFIPANENSGLTFIVKGERIPANLNNAENKNLGICLKGKNQRAYLVEHLLSAVYALGIDNLDIVLPGNVCPTTNNCAQEYFNTLKHNVVEQNGIKRFWKFSRPNQVILEDLIKGRPDKLTVSYTDGFFINYTSYYPHKVIGKQNIHFKFGDLEYQREIYQARPPGFIKNQIFISLMKLSNFLGMYNGVNQVNYLLVGSKKGEYGNCHKYGVRYEGQEFVRHKVLDVCGTLALTGRQFKDTEFRFKMTGHRSDIIALKELFARKVFVDSI